MHIRRLVVAQHINIKHDISKSLVTNLVRDLNVIWSDHMTYQWVLICVGLRRLWCVETTTPKTPKLYWPVRFPVICWFIWSPQSLLTVCYRLTYSLMGSLSLCEQVNHLQWQWRPSAKTWELVLWQGSTCSSPLSMMCCRRQEGTKALEHAVVLLPLGAEWATV